jgi:hypothetical protein
LLAQPAQETIWVKRFCISSSMNRDCLEQYPGNQSRIWPLLLLFILRKLKAALLIFTACSHDDQRETRRDTWHPPLGGFLPIRLPPPPSALRRASPKRSEGGKPDPTLFRGFYGF